MRAFLSRHVAGNASFWGLVEYGAGPAAALVALLPMLFRQLGTVGFGQYSMIIALAGFGNAANLGAAVTATKLVSERAHEPGGAYRAAGVGMALISCALAVVSAIALLLWLVVGLGWPGATFGGVAVTLLAMPALAVYLTQQYDQLLSGCLKGREDFRATALCGSFRPRRRHGAGPECSCSRACTAHALLRPVIDRPAMMMAAFRFSRWSWLNSQARWPSARWTGCWSAA